jgi:hypothetical protein
VPGLGDDLGGTGHQPDVLGALQEMHLLDHNAVPVEEQGGAAHSAAKVGCCEAPAPDAVALQKKRLSHATPAHPWAISLLHRNAGRGAGRRA